MLTPYWYELKVRKKVKKELQKQFNFLVEHGEELYNKVFLRYFTSYKTLDGIEKDFSRLEDFWEEMGIYRMIDKLKTDIKKVLQLGFKVSYRKHQEDMELFNVSFDLNNPAVSEYMRKFEDLHLSNYKGSISLTTKNAVIAELRKGVEQNLSYTEVAKNIQALDKTVFSLNRAKLIATNETGKAYEFGNYVPMKEAANQGATVEKKRSNVWDARVSRQCLKDSAADWISLNESFPSWNDMAPGHVSCRCTILYRIK